MLDKVYVPNGDESRRFAFMAVGVFRRRGHGGSQRN